MMDPHHDRDFAARTNRDEVARLTARVVELEAALRHCMGELDSVYHSEFDGVWADSDFADAMAPYVAALAQGQGE